MMVPQDFSWKETEKVFHIFFGMLFDLKLSRDLKEGRGLIIYQEYVGWEHRNFVICMLFHVEGRAKSASSYIGDSDITVKL